MVKWRQQQTGVEMNAAQLRKAAVKSAVLFEQLSELQESAVSRLERM